MLSDRIYLLNLIENIIPQTVLALEGVLICFLVASANPNRQATPPQQRLHPRSCRGAAAELLRSCRHIEMPGKPRKIKGFGPGPEIHGILLDKNRRRQLWLQTRYLLCQQTRHLLCQQPSHPLARHQTSQP